MTKKDPLLERAKRLREMAEAYVQVARALRRTAQQLEKETWKYVRELEAKDHEKQREKVS